jgi:hypothetical protein
LGVGAILPLRLPQRVYGDQRPSGKPSFHQDKRGKIGPSVREKKIKNDLELVLYFIKRDYFGLPP